MNKTILLCLIVFSIVFLLSNEELVPDYDFHFAKSQDLDSCTPPHKIERCNSYPPISHLVSSPFSIHPVVFKTYHFFLLLLIIPLLLHKLTGTFSSTVFYFGTTIWFGVVDGTIAQTFAMIWFLLFLLNKNIWIRLLLLISSLLVHQVAFYLLFIYWILDLIPFNKLKYAIAIPSFPNPHVAPVKIISKLIMETNLLIILDGFKNSLKPKNLKFLFLIVASLIMSLGILRSIWVAQLCLIILACDKELTKEELVFSLFWIVFIINWLLVKVIFIKELIIWAGAIFIIFPISLRVLKEFRK